MSILPKKEKEKLVIQAFQEFIKYLPKVFNLMIFCIVLTIGTCLGWNPILIGAMTGTVITGNIQIPIKKDSNKN